MSKTIADCDILLEGGHVIDPKNGLDGVADVAIGDGRIAAVGPGLPGCAGKTVDVSGLCVTPGLIDIHAHVYRGFPGWLFPDGNALPNGVTTVVDAGSSGWRGFEDLRETIIEPSCARVLAFLNIVGEGMSEPYEQDVAEMNPEPCAEAVQKHPEHVVGVKSAHYNGPGWESAGGALRASRLGDTIAMIDFEPQPSRTFEELLTKMDPGDIVTHVFSAYLPLLDENGEINGCFRKARDRGVVFDTGHGNGSFLFRIAAPCLEQGFPPDTISTDLHKRSRLVPYATMPSVMSKFLAMGMPLQEVIYRATQRPAEVIRRPELGHLTEGSEADIAVFSLVEGGFGMVDSGRTRMEAEQRLECCMTLRAGEVVWDANGLSCPDWKEAGQYFRLDRPWEEPPIVSWGE